MRTLAAWVHDISPFVWRISGDFGLRWYGLSYLLGFALAWLLMWWMAKRRICLIPVDRVPDAMLMLAFGVLAGGRLGYAIVYDPTLFGFSSSPPWWRLLAINEGGMASHGGMIGVVLASWWIARRMNAPLPHVLDTVAAIAPPGLMFGRIANFVNGELLGKIVAGRGEPAPWWSVKYPQELLSPTLPPPWAPGDADRFGELCERVAPGAPLDKAIPAVISAVQHGAADVKAELAPLLTARHPSQLYQALAEGPILFMALWLIWAKPRKPGVIGAWFLIVYGALRIVTEVWRLPDDHLKVARPMGLSRGQWLSAAMIVAGVISLAFVVRRKVAPMGGWRKKKAIGNGQ